MRRNKAAILSQLRKSLQRKNKKTRKTDATSSDSEITRFLNDSVPVRAKAFPKLYVGAQVLYSIKFFHERTK